MARIGKNVIEGGNPKLVRFLVNGGKEYSLSLEYHLGYDRETGKSTRRRECLKLRYPVQPRNAIETQEKRDTIELARKIRWEREQEFLEQREGYRLHRDRKIYFLDFYQTYIDNYTKADAKMIRIARNRFRDFLVANGHQNPELLMPEAMNKEMMLRFADYLQTRSRGEGASSIFQRFKKVVKNCVEKGYLKKNPCDGVKIYVDKQAIRKDFLSAEEIKKLLATHYSRQNLEVRKAFIFCLYTGIRWCDVERITWANIDIGNKLLKIDQKKENGRSTKSWICTPLSDALLRLIGKPPKNFARESPVFFLPSYESSLKQIKNWVQKAGLEKHISLHCARHSFAVNILSDGRNNIRTLQTLLGHSSLEHTVKYLRVVDPQKEAAIASLPELKLDDEEEKVL
ncbi:MAG: site-specific integrase [Bacteroidaceae bacterium]|nr:site-specific integrase [Bacteroidaceae bacterium]